MQQAFRAIDELRDRTRADHIMLTEIPAPPFNEQARAERYAELLREAGADSVWIDAEGNVLALRRGTEGGNTIVLSGHLDTVFPEGTDVTVRVSGDTLFAPGVGDDTRGLIVVLTVLRTMEAAALETRGDILFVGTVGEEGLGDLRGMKAVVERFGGDVQAYLVIEGLALGHVYHRAVGVKRYRVTARTAGGHSWSDYGKPSAIHELAKLVVQLASLQLPGQPRTTMNVGRITGGTSINVIASEAALDLDLRSEGQEFLAELVGAVERLTRNANREDVRVEAEVIGHRPAGEIRPDHPLVKLAEDCLREQGFGPNLTSGSTDANVTLSKGYPAVVLGVSTGGSAHTVNEFIHTGPVASGLEQLLRFVKRVWE